MPHALLTWQVSAKRRWRSIKKCWLGRMFTTPTMKPRRDCVWRTRQNGARGRGRRQEQVKQVRRCSRHCKILLSFDVHSLHGSSFVFDRRNPRTPAAKLPTLTHPSPNAYKTKDAGTDNPGN